MWTDFHLVPDEAEDVVGGPPAGLGDVVGAVVGRREALHEGAAVAALGHGLALGPGEHAAAERADLPAGVVDVVLAGDLVAAALQQPAERVAVGGEPAVADVDRAGGVGRDELDLHPLAGAERRGGRSRRCPPSTTSDSTSCSQVGAEVEVDEAGAGDLAPRGRAPAGARSGGRRARSASSRGLRPAALAVARATFEDQSPCSRRAGRSSWTPFAGGSTPTAARAAEMAVDEVVADHGRLSARGASRPGRAARRARRAW